MYYFDHFIDAAVAAKCISTGAIAGKCTDQIKALQQSAAMTDAKNEPGNQARPNDSGSAKTEGTANVDADKGAPTHGDESYRAHCTSTLRRLDHEGRRVVQPADPAAEDRDDRGQAVSDRSLTRST